MRGWISVVGMTFAVVACSSSDEDACVIEGTYSATAVMLPGGSCPDTNNDPVVDTITARPPGTTGGPDFYLQITGTQGGCPLNRVAGSACKVQGKCDVQLIDALDPNNAMGTVQYSWTFDANGFTGTSTVIVPAAKSLPKGCTAQASVTGKRQ